MAQNDKKTSGDNVDLAKIKTKLTQEDAGLLRKFLNKGKGVISSTEDNVRSIVGELTLPKELMNYFMSQIDRTKTDIVNLIGREVSQFLQATNVSEEVVKALSQLEISVKAEVKFKHSSESSDKEENNDTKSGNPLPPITITAKTSTESSENDAPGGSRKRKKRS